MSSLEFQINLGGNFAAVLGEATGELGKTDAQTQRAQKTFENFDRELHQVEEQLKRIKGNPEQFEKLMKAQHELSEATKKGREESEGFRHQLFEWVEIGKEVGEVIEGVADRVVELGKEIVDTAAKTQDINLAVKLNVGEENVEKIDELAETFKEKTRFSATQIKQALLPLLQQGLGNDVQQLGDLTAAATDYAARTNTGIAGVQTALESFGNIALRGQVNFRLLKQLKISENDFNDELASLLHTDRAGAVKLEKEGKAGKDNLLTAALNLIARQQGGNLGPASEKSAATLGGTLDKLSHLKENLFEGIADSPGMHAVQGFLDNFIATMEGPIGKDLVNKISDAFTSLFGDLSGPDGLAKMEDVIGSIAKKAGEFIDGFSSAWPEIQADFEAALPVVEKLADLLGGIAKVLTALPRVAGEAGDRGGQSVVDDVTGTVGRKDVVGGGHLTLDEQDREAILGRAGKNGFFHQLFSRDKTLNREAFQQLEDENNPWEDVPQLAAGGIVTRPTLALIGEAGPEAVIPLDGSNRGGITIGDIIFQLAPGTPMEQVQEAAQIFRSELQSFINEVPA